MGGPGSGAKPKEDPPELVERVRALYASGLTMREVAARTDLTVKILQRLMPRHGIERRPAIKRNQSGPQNDSWKGDSASYKAFHLRVATARGKPSRCSACERTDDGTRYEWASLTRRYADIHDYVRLCSGCHRRFDAFYRRR